MKVQSLQMNLPQLPGYPCNHSICLEDCEPSIKLFCNNLYFVTKMRMHSCYLSREDTIGSLYPVFFELILIYISSRSLMRLRKD